MFNDVIIILLSVFVFVSAAELLDVVGTFSFNKSSDTSGEFDFV